MYIILLLSLVIVGYMVGNLKFIDVIYLVFLLIFVCGLGRWS